MHFAAIDIGTNSVRLLITDETGKALERRMQITRLGQGVDQTCALDEHAIDRTVQVLATYGEAVRAHAPCHGRATATSAVRDAQNRGAFLDAAERALGFRPDLISGEEEAALSFAGATSGLAPARGPFLVIDIGGGSTEFVLGQDQPEALLSLDMGCVRMTERHLRSDPPNRAAVDACRADVRAELGRVRPRIDTARARCVIGLAGTVTALACLQQGLRHYDPELTHHAELDREQVRLLCEELLSKDVEARRAMLAEPKRAEVIVGGAVILSELMQVLDIERLLVSESDILDGTAAQLARAQLR